MSSHYRQMFIKTFSTFVLSYDCSSAMKYFIFVSIEYHQKMFLIIPHFISELYVCDCIGTS